MSIDDYDLEHGLSSDDRVIALRWEHLNDEEKLGVLVQLDGTDVTEAEIYAGYYLRVDSNTVVFVEPAEIH